MSRIGRKIIAIPEGVNVSIADRRFTVKGPKGENRLDLHPRVQVVQEDNSLRVSVADPGNKTDRALWGLHRALLANAIQGVTEPFIKKLEMVGVGYRAAVQGNKLVLEAGFSHSVEMIIPEGIACTVEKNTITIVGVDKQRVGAFAADVRAVRKPEPYKGKGIKYAEEVIRRKAGKAAKAAGAA